MTDRIDALTTLLTRLVDSRAGYETALGHVSSPTLRSTMTAFMDRRARNAAEVRSYLDRAGQTPSDDTSLLADAHRVFLDLEQKVAGADEATVLAEVVRGERTLMDAYDAAITVGGGHDPEFEFLVSQRASLSDAVERLDTRRQVAA